MTTDKHNKRPNVPPLRFPEFSGEWNRTSIGDKFELYSGNTPSRLEKDQFVGKINWITSGELKNHYIAATNETITEEAAANNNLRLLPIGTFVIAIYGLEAAGVRSTGSIENKIKFTDRKCRVTERNLNIDDLTDRINFIVRQLFLVDKRKQLIHAECRIVMALDFADNLLFECSIINTLYLNSAVKFDCARHAFNIKRNAVAIGTINPEHLGGRGIGTAWQNLLADQAVDKSGFSGAVQP